MLKSYKKFLNKILKVRKLKFVNKNFFSSKRFLEVMRSVFGINYYVSFQILRLFGYSKNIKFEKINNKSVGLIIDFFLSYFLVERGLKKYRNNLLVYRKEIGVQSGYRLFKGLPVNGQRTHTNAKTVRKMFKFYNINDI
jgi:small subunit ribosomal protein S13